MMLVGIDINSREKPLTIAAFGGRSSKQTRAEARTKTKTSGSEEWQLKQENSRSYILFPTKLIVYVCHKDERTCHARVGPNNI